MSTLKDIYKNRIARHKSETEDMEREYKTVKPWLTTKISSSQFNSHLKNNGKIIEMINAGLLVKKSYKRKEKTCYVLPHREAKGVYIFWHISGFCGYVGQGNLYRRVSQCWNSIEKGPQTFPNSTGGHQASRHLREYDPNPDNWLVQYRIVEADVIELRLEIEDYYQKIYEPRFNFKKVAVAGIAPTTSSL